MSLPLITVLGGSGFIGSRLVEQLRRQGRRCDAPVRGTSLEGRHLGHVIYCVGLTGDFRQAPYDTVDAHVTTLMQVLRHCRFDSFLYLSSTRVYARHSRAIASEQDDLQLQPACFDDLYNLSKAMGESLVLGTGPGTRVARLSSVYGEGAQDQAFVSSIVRDALTKDEVTFTSSLTSTRDHVNVAHVIDVLPRIALEGTERIYHVASGRSVTNQQLGESLTRLTGCRVQVRADAGVVTMPAIDIGRIRREFAFAPSCVLDDLPELVSALRSRSAHVLD